MKILVIEDERELLGVIRQSLEKEHFLVEEASDFEAAMRKIIAYDYDCILLDIMLPGGNGMDILKELKTMRKADNVIIISANDSLDDKVQGLNLGADDYLTKPFHIAELNARIRSVLRRKAFSGKNILELGNVKLDLDERTASINNKAVAFNRKELDVLTYFMVNHNRLVLKTALAEHVWGAYADEANDYEFLYSQIKNLRKKLNDHDSGLEIRAVYGIGYKMQVT
ncbi:response regulator transcription factor [Niabella hibiscisoli]|uniref:response regulator transcription factor n=1 Tax=Niabella hibiscisoli TaxID=1825928 RepID=UPI001F0FE28A|nr:response regulator transcription factor [Niabella hibiscisoli]MCH5721081.1 response regulator transcription factor [Niabella hibiscisoli]